MDEIIAKVSDEALRAKLTEAWKAHTTALDTAKGEARAAKAAETAAAKAKADADKALAKATADLDAASKGQGEQLTKAAEAKIAAELLATKASEQLVAVRTRYAVERKLRASGVADETALTDALSLFRLPAGAAVDEAGALTGADAALDEFLKARPHLKGQTSGRTGREQGSTSAASRGGSGNTTERDDIDAAKAAILKRRGLKVAGQ